MRRNSPVWPAPRPWAPLLAEIHDPSPSHNIWLARKRWFEAARVPEVLQA